MSIEQKAVNSGMNEVDDQVDVTLKDKFELHLSHLTGEQLAQYLAQTFENLPGKGVKVISIVGGPASGKGTLVKSLTAELNNRGLKADSIGTDDYNLGTREWRRERERDNPLSLKDFALMNQHIEAIKNLGKEEVVAVPVYDQPTGLAIEVGEENFPHKVGKVDVLFVEGDFDPVENPDLMVFVDVPIEARMQARIDRDLKDRGEVDAEKVANNFRSRHESQYIPHTAPAISKTDLVLKVNPIPGAWQYDVYHPRQAA